jgi:acetyl-CoA C-acetyltransferase
MRPVHIAAALRTPIGRFGGSLAGWTAADMGTAVVQALIAQARLDPAAVDEVVFGNARQAGGGPNVARQISVRSGIPATVPAWTVNQACGSGLKAILAGAQAIACGEAGIVVAGGTESMSRLPFLLEGVRWGSKLGAITAADAMYRDGFSCPLAGELMGETVERLARERDISREEQDRFALESQRKAHAAAVAGRFTAELVALPQALATDEHPRPETTLETLSRLPPVFSREGTLTAGNSSGITDGAAAVLLVAGPRLDGLGLAPLARIEASAAAGVDPRAMGIGPVPAVRALLARTGGGLDRFDLVEVNEAFAAQVLAVQRDLEIPAERLNVNGGAIALGHPIGCSGARLVVTLVSELGRRGARTGLATLCISGGMGLAVSLVAGGAGD